MSDRRRPSPSTYMRYWFDRLISWGLPGLLLIAVLGAILLLLIVAPVFFALDAVTTGEVGFGHFLALYWSAVLALFKAGEATGPWPQQISRLVFAIVALLFTGAVFGTVIGALRDKVKSLRDKGGEIIATDHTVVLGWSPLGFRIIDELAIVNQARNRPWIAVLADERKSELEGELSGRVSRRSTKIAVRSVARPDSEHLDMVRASSARSVIVLGGWLSAQHDSDTITSLLLLTRYAESHPEFDATVVAGIVKPENLPGARAAAPGALIVSLDQMASQMMFQVARQPGLIQVYESLLSFDGHAIRTVRDPDLAGLTFREAVLAKAGSTPIGIMRDGVSEVLPPMDTVISDTDQVVVLTDGTAGIGRSLDSEPSAIPAVALPGEAGGQKWLHLGWSRTTADVLAKHDAALTVRDCVTLVVRPEHADEAAALSGRAFDHLSVDTIIWPHDQSLAGVLSTLDMASFSRIVVFVQRDADGRPNDAQTLLARLQIRGLLEQLPSARVAPLVVAELSDEYYRRISTADDARDMFVGSQMVALLLAQLSENPHLLDVYGQLLGGEGCGIDLGRATDYLEDGRGTYAAAAVTAASRGQIAIGYQLASEAGDRETSYGVRISPGRLDPILLGSQDSLILIHRQSS